MTTENIKKALDAFYTAKRITEILPLLPKGVTPSYIRYLDIIGKLKKSNECIKVSDISLAIGVQRPGVTRTVMEMEKKGYLRKISSSDDGRVTYLEITQEGEKLSKKYNEDVFIPLKEALSSLRDEDLDVTIATINLFYEALTAEEYNGQR